MKNKSQVIAIFTAALLALAIIAAPRFISAQSQAQTPPPSQQQSSAQQAPPAQPQAAAVPPFTLKPLGHNAFAAIAVPGGGAGSNASFIIGEDGVLVVDTYQRVEAARALLAKIHELTPLPIRYVVNTHYHIDHVTGNGVFAEAGAIIFAHKNVRDWIHVENLKFYGANITPAQKASVEALTAPMVVYTTGVDLYLGQRHIFVRYFPGHTGGDSMVFDPESNVVFCGDIFWRHTLPNLIDASTDAWIETLNAMIQAHPAAAFVSGHGDVGTVEDVKAFRGYLMDLRQWVGGARATGKTGDAIVDEVVPKIKEKYGDWGALNNFSIRNVQQTAEELNATKKVPRPLPQ
ncbi:MAG: MBL fold metallo-hydrolase [Candidatus Acidiferrales bacterium]